MKSHYSNFYLGVIHAPMYTISNFFICFNIRTVFIDTLLSQTHKFFSTHFFSIIFFYCLGEKKRVAFATPDIHGNAIYERNWFNIDKECREAFNAP